MYALLNSVRLVLKIIFLRFTTYAYLRSGMSDAVRKLTQVGIEYTCVQLCMCVEGSPVETVTPAHCNPIDLSMTAWRLILSPSSILPSPSLHCIFIPARKTFSAGFKNAIPSIVSRGEPVTRLSERPISVPWEPGRGHKPQIINPGRSVNSLSFPPASLA